MPDVAAMIMRYCRVALFLLAIAPALAQIPYPCASVSPEAAKSQFDAISLKPGGPFTPGGNPFAILGGPGSDDPGRLTASHAALSALITRAYGLDSDRFQGPAWITDAANHGFALVATMPVSTGQEQFCGMLRNLLAQRFHLTFHFEKQPRPGYELTILPGGPKFKEFLAVEAAPGEGRGYSVDANGFPKISPSQATAMSMSISRTGAWKVSFRNNMTLFARGLAADINQSNGITGPGVPLPRVVDRTGLRGIYDIRLEFAGQPFPSQAAEVTAPAPDPVDVAPNIFTAVQQQLGLKLTKAADVQVDVLIVDHIDQTPTEN